MPLQLANIVIDCQNPEKLAEFWSEAIGYTKVGIFNQYAVLEDPARKGSNLLLQQVLEPRSGKNRVHWDWLAPNKAEQQSEIARLIELDATKISETQESDASWTVMQDPEGNEFCVAFH